jgi:hypothetical protein
VPAPVSASVFAIYNAEGSLAGELRYAMTKTLGGTTCALCDITHGWNPRGKRVWRDCEGLTKRVQWLHKDEVSPELSVAVANQTLPCVIADLGGRIELLLDCGELESCNGDFAVFEKLLQEKITELNRLLPSGTANHEHKKGAC